MFTPSVFKEPQLYTLIRSYVRRSSARFLMSTSLGSRHLFADLRPPRLPNAITELQNAIWPRLWQRSATNGKPDQFLGQHGQNARNDPRHFAATFKLRVSATARNVRSASSLIARLLIPLRRFLTPRRYVAN